MGDWIVKLTRDRGQTRVTLPRLLIAEVGFDDVEVVRLRRGMRGMIIIEEYHGKSKEKRDIPEDQA